MILTALLWGAGILAGVGIVAAFWNDIVKFLKKAVEKVELADLGEDLYVAKNQRSDAKMTRREISLD